MDSFNLSLKIYKTAKHTFINSLCKYMERTTIIFINIKYIPYLIGITKWNILNKQERQP